MLEMLKPCMTAPDAYGIDYAALKQENVRCVLFDIDNTLVPDGAPAGTAACGLVERLRTMGFKVMLISNGAPARVLPFARKTRAECVCRAGKPRPDACLRALKTARCRPEHAVFIGDQLFTDVLAANRAGVISCLVAPISRREPWTVRIKRPFEKTAMKLLRIKYDSI